MGVATSAGLAGYHFLVVDDQEFVRHIVREALVSSGVRDIETAINGEEAIELIKARSETNPVDSVGPVKPGTISDSVGGFDCVVTDFNMQPVTGLQLLQDIRTGNTGAPRDTPVALLTAHSDAYLVASALALDVNAFVLKPVSRFDLLTRVVRAMKNYSNPKSIAEYTDEVIPGPISSLALKKHKGAGVAHGVVLDQVAEIRKSKKKVVPQPDGSVQSVRLQDVQPGATLLEDVRSGKGVVLLARGTPMTAQLVDKLLDLKDLPGLTEKILIQL